MTRSSAALSPYLHALTVGSLRCFAAPQTLSLTAEGRPARWTTVLGDNGVGKTTLLQLLAYLRPSPSMLSGESSVSRNLIASGYPGFHWHGWARARPEDPLGAHAISRSASANRCANRRSTWVRSGRLGSPSR